MKTNNLRSLMVVMVTIIALFASSCNKTDMEAIQNAKYSVVCDEQSALENFSISLSKAVYTYPEVREFLKREALKRFDNDDDVFYPFELCRRDDLVYFLGGSKKHGWIVGGYGLFYSQRGNR